MFSNNLLNVAWHKIVYFLILILPFNHLLTQVLNYYFKIPQTITLYKEFLFIVLILIMLFQVIQSLTKNNSESKVNNILSHSILKTSLIPIISLISLLFFGLISTLRANLSLKYWLLGFRVELLWVCLLGVGIIWIKQIKPQIQIQKILDYTKLSYLGVLGIAIFSNIVGIEKFYNILGFQNGWESDGLVLESPICHGFGVDGVCRLTAGFSTPNNLAGYLLLVLPVLVIIYNQNKKIRSRKLWNLFLIVSCLACIYLTYSRFALLALGLGGLWFLKNYFYNHFYSKTRLYKVSNIFNKINRILNWGLLLMPIGFLVIFLQLVSNTGLINNLPPSISRLGSSNGHYKLTSLSVEVISTRFSSLILQGYGLSQTGPIAKPQYQDVLNTKFVLENQNLANKYSLPAYEISIPENWYLQMWLNGGLVYLIAFLVLLSNGLWPLFNSRSMNQNSSLFDYKLFLVISIFMICVGNLFLHIWENPVITFYFTIWVLVINVTKTNDLT